jgi:hypothetical protein
MRKIELKSTAILGAFTICLLLLASCQVTQKTKAAAESTAYKQIAQEKLGDDLKFTPSEDNKFVLCETKASSDPDNGAFQFLVFDTEAEKIVMEKKVTQGYVRWVSAKEVEVFSTPGIMREDQTRDDFTVVYDVVTGKATPKTAWKK